MSTTALPLAAKAQPRALSFYAATVLGFMVLVILWGAVVRATGSGAGCGDHWPLCNGQFFPSHPRLATVIEFAHRSMSGFLTMLIAVLIGWTFLRRPRGHRARRAAVWTGVLLVTEALLGAVLVKGGYVEANTSTARVAMQCIHFTNTMLLLAALTLTWWWVRDREGVASNPKLRPIAWLSLAATILTGATGSVAALADTLFPSPSLHAALAQDFNTHAPLIVRMRWLHPAAAVLALGFAIWLSLGVGGRMGRWVLALIATQFVLGGLDVLLLAPIWMQMLHLLTADLYWIALVALSSAVLTTKRESARNKLS
jgi:cytochrome c oxidase assembly protein subunit 15